MNEPVFEKKADNNEKGRTKRMNAKSIWFNDLWLSTAYIRMFAHKIAAILPTRIFLNVVPITLNLIH